MANTNITTEFATIGADKVVSAMQATDAALIKATNSARQQTEAQQKQATTIRQLRDAEREEQQQLKLAHTIVERATTDDQKHNRELKALQVARKAGTISVRDYNAAVGDSKARLDAATGANKSMIGGIAQTAAAVTGVGSAIGVVYAAIRLVRAEIDQIHSRRKTAAEKSIDFENALTETRFNVGKFLSPEEQRANALELSTKYGISPARAARLQGETATSTGIQNAADLKTALDAAGAAAAIRPDLGDEQISALGAAAGSLGKTYGINPKQAIGFINRVGQQSNIAELTKQVENITPALAGLKNNGATTAQAGALIATVTQKAFDTEGAKSFTGTVNFADSMRQAYRDDSRFTAADGTFDFDSALTYLRDNPDQARIFIQGGKLDNGKKVGKAKTGKGQLKSFFEELVGLLPGDTYDRYKASEQIIGTFADGEANYNELLAANKENNVLSNLDRRFESTTAAVAATDSAAIAGILRSRLPDLEKSLGSSSIGSKVSSISRDFLDDGLSNPVAAAQTAVEQLRAVLAELEATPGDRNKQLADFLRPLIEELEAATAETRTRFITDSLETSPASNYEPGALKTAREGLDEVLIELVDPAHREYIRNRFENALRDKEDPRTTAQAIIRNFDLRNRKERDRVLDPEKFAEQQLAIASAGLPAEQRADLLSRLTHGNSPASRGTGRLRPIHDARDIIDNFDLEKSQQGAEVLAVLERILAVNERQAAEPRPFVPERGTVPPDTVQLSRERGDRR